LIPHQERRRGGRRFFLLKSAITIPPKEEAGALLESPGNNHGSLDGNKRIAFPATDVFLRRNGFYIEVEAWMDTHSPMARWSGRNSAVPQSSTGFVNTSGRLANSSS
jgi:hypothetical protein